MPTRLSLDIFQSVARRHGGECLSKFYLNNATPLHMRCAEGHDFWPTPLNLRHAGSWCPTGAARQRALRYSLADCREAASAHGGRCHGTVYRDNRTKLEWECEVNHHFSMTWEHVRQGHWCPQCAISKAAKQRRHKYNLWDCRRLARKRSGRCLSHRYRNASHQKLKWRCSDGHEWRATFLCIRLGTWCPRCAIKLRYRNTILSLADLRATAEQHGGKCLSTHYHNANRRVRWECAKGHRWKAKPGDVRHGSWCPRCSHRHSKAEERIRRVIELVTGLNFPFASPSWLHVRGRRLLELDGYNEQHKVAFEYQGYQHYRPIYGIDQLEKLKRNDRRKRDLCRRHGVLLICIPYWKRNVKAVLRRKLAAYL